MERDILTAIVAVEKEIGERLAAERSRAEAGLAQLRREMADEINREEESLELALREALATARAEAATEAARLLDEATARAERMARLDDRALEEIVARHLSRILPGRGDDRQNVQG